MNKRSIVNKQTSTDEIKQRLHQQGWVLLRDEGYDLGTFSSLMNRLCERLTFDPAREYSSPQTQTVDAGTDAVGLHIENGNTPLPPDIVAFHSALSATKGSQTTVCDGAEVYHNLPAELKLLFGGTMTVSRYLPKPIWQRYVAKALAPNGGVDESDISLSDLDLFMQKVPGQSYSLAHDDGIEYTLKFQPVRSDNVSGVRAFANAILGPSYNYQTPIYRFSDRTELSQEIIEQLRELCERYTQEIAWQDGDVAVIDNKRIMHGRREILVPLNERKLYIGMGLNLHA